MRGIQFFKTPAAGITITSAAHVEIMRISLCGGLQGTSGLGLRQQSPFTLGSLLTFHLINSGAAGADTLAEFYVNVKSHPDDTTEWKWLDETTIDAAVNWLTNWALVHKGHAATAITALAGAGGYADRVLHVPPAFEIIFTGKATAAKTVVMHMSGCIQTG